MIIIKLLWFSFLLLNVATALHFSKFYDFYLSACDKGHSVWPGAQKENHSIKKLYYYIKTIHYLKMKCFILTKKFGPLDRSLLSYNKTNNNGWHYFMLKLRHSFGV